MSKPIRTVISIFFSLLVISTAPSAWSDAIPTVGAILPDFSMNAPSAQKQRAYLNLDDVDEFTLNAFAYDLLIIEIIGVYCPRCHIQIPRVNTLFNRIEIDSQLAGKVKIIAIAAGANLKEVSYLVKQFNIPYPVIVDSDFSIRKRFGEPLTPFNVIVNPERRVVYVHKGSIENVDKFITRLKTLLP